MQGTGLTGFWKVQGGCQPRRPAGRGMVEGSETSSEWHSLITQRGGKAEGPQFGERPYVQIMIIAFQRSPVGLSPSGPSGHLPG